MSLTGNNYYNKELSIQTSRCKIKYKLCCRKKRDYWTLWKYFLNKPKTDKNKKFFLLLSISYRSYGSQTWLIKLNAVSSKKRLSQYCYMDALHGRWLNSRRKSYTATTKECGEQFWTRPGGNIPQGTNCTATYLPSRKLSKLDEADMQDTAGEAGTSSEVINSYGPHHMAEQKQCNHFEPTYNKNVRIRDVALIPARSN